MSDVFISYAREDRSRARRVVKALERRGFSVWWDLKLETGDKFRGEILRRLRAASCVVVLWSQVSVEKTFVADEAARAADRRKLVPALLDPVLDRLPLGFGELQAKDLTRWRGDELAPRFEELVSAILQIRAREAPELPPPKPSRTILSRLAGLFNDRKTQLVLGLLAAAAALLWLLWGRSVWRISDARLWAALAVTCVVGWCGFRGLERAGSRGGPLAAAALTILGLGAWTWWAWSFYRPDAFEAGAAGIYVARFVDDPGDRLQRRWSSLLKEAGEKVSPRLAPEISETRTSVPTSEAARRLARQGNALVVIWGETALQRITLVEGAGLLRRGGGSIRSSKELELGATDLDLARGLVRLAAAHNAFRLEAYDSARDVLEKGVTLLEETTRRADTDSLLATLHLFLGNVYLLHHCKGQAQAHYCDEAREQFRLALDRHQVDGASGNPYVEASNNLAVALSASGEADAAREVLAEAKRGCDDYVETEPLACAFVELNLGLASIEDLAYEEAIAHLEKALTLAQSLGDELGEEARLPADCGQQLAYAAAKLGEKHFGSDEGQRWFRRAQSYLDESLRALPAKYDADVPPNFKITEARIAVGLGGLDKAGRLLSGIVREESSGQLVLDSSVAERFPGIDGKEVVSLFAIARLCTDRSGFSLDPGSVTDYFYSQIKLCLQR